MAYKLAEIVLILIILTFSQKLAARQNIIIYTGGNWGGLTGSLPFSETTNVSHATKLGANIGLHTELNIYGNHIETGLDYVYYNQDFIYNDSLNNISGTRTFFLHALTIPLTYNFHFFNREDGNPWLVFGIGMFGSWFFYEKVTDAGRLTDYHLNNANYGIYLHFIFYPFEFLDKNLLGIYVNLSRSINSNNFYSDKYILNNNAAGTASTTFGLAMKF